MLLPSWAGDRELSPVPFWALPRHPIEASLRSLVNTVPGVRL